MINIHKTSILYIDKQMCTFHKTRELALAEHLFEKITEPKKKKKNNVLWKLRHPPALVCRVKNEKKIDVKFYYNQLTWHIN